MLTKVTKLSFIIGLFFTLVSLVLLIGRFISTDLASDKNLYSGIVFFVFGLVMMLITPKNTE